MKKLLLACSLLLVMNTVNAQKTLHEKLIGCWTMPGKHGESLQLNRSGDFSFNDFNAKTNSFEMITGHWKEIKGKLELLYEDRPKQTFSIGAKGKDNLFLYKTGGVNLVKAQPADCSSN